MYNILLVEDDPDLREIMHLVLSNGFMGCTLHEADTGGASFAVVDQRTPDLLLLDVQLPDVSGITLYKLLRLRPDLKDVPVLFVTANPQLVHEAGLAGPHACLAKPFDLSQLVERARALLDHPSTSCILSA
jgi:DNA-binding response OmpR family regulator